MLKALLIIILIIGILIAVYKYKDIDIEDDNKSTKNTHNIETFEQICPLPIPEYRYIPRTFEEEQLEPVYPSEIFETMFSQPSPWLLSIRNYDRKKQEQINQYFISQL